MFMKPDSCKDCPYYNKRPVESEGRDDALIALIGEAPGVTEEQTGRVFSGGAGNMLDKLLYATGLKRGQDVKIINVLKCRPDDTKEKNNDIDSPSAKKAIRMCGGIFIDEIQRLNSRVIVPLGGTALRALGFAYKINEVRGTYFDYRGIPVIPTLHPAALMRQFEDWVVVQSDFKKAIAIAKTGQRQLPNEQFITTPSVEDVEIFCGEICRQADASPQSIPVAVDIETFETDHDLRTPIKIIGLASDGERAIAVPFITQSGNEYWKTKTEAARAIRAIARVLEHPNILKLGQNLLFDFRILTNHGFIVVGPVWDSMIAHFLVYHPIAHNLQTIASLYTDFPPWKTLKGLDDVEYRKYNCRDTTVLHYIYPKLNEEIDANGVRWVFDHVMETLLPYCQMSLNGLPIDKTAQQEVERKLREDRLALTKELQQISGALGLNPNSTKQLSDILFKQMKLKSGVKTAKGAQSVAKDVLNRLAIRYPENLFVQKLLEYNSLEQLYSTYAQPDIFADGRVHPHFKLAVITGRPSSVNPNVLNLPAKRGDPQGYIKSMYVAPPGRIFVEADWSQAELVIFATISNDREWLDCFAKGDDVHKLNGIALTGEYEEVYRTFYKNFIYGFIYGSEGSEVAKVAPIKLIQRIAVPAMIEKFKIAHPNMFKYRENLEQQINTTHRIRNPFGRPRFFVGHVSKENLREAYNFPIQSTVADMMNTKIATFAQEFEAARYKTLMPLYDALYFEIVEQDKTSFLPVVKQIMEEPVTAPNGQTFTLKVEIKVGTSFANLKKEGL